MPILEVYLIYLWIFNGVKDVFSCVCNGSRIYKKNLLKIKYIKYIVFVI